MSQVHKRNERVRRDDVKIVGGGENKGVRTMSRHDGGDPAHPVETRVVDNETMKDTKKLIDDDE